MRYEKPRAEQAEFCGKTDILLMSGDNEQNVADLLEGLLPTGET